jgi:hypothetical protein
MINDTKIIIDWVKEETENKEIVIKNNKKFWKILNYIFTFTLGFFIGFILNLLINF